MKARRSQKPPAPLPRLSPAELHAWGKSLREKCPRTSHAAWTAPHDRPDPIRLLKLSNKGRIPELIPIRFGRMVPTPFTFYRGAALNMAADLAVTPATGLRVQACGDCHLLNFGGFATPERRIIFDINDLDETLPAPWEWDVKRLAASFVLACRSSGLSAGAARDAVLSCVRAYRSRMAEYSQMSVLEVWYASIDCANLIPGLMARDKEASRLVEKGVAAARSHDVEHDFPKLADKSGQTPTIRDNPPLIYHPGRERGFDVGARTRVALASYRRSLSDDLVALLDRYEVVDVAMKVVGVGSVGTFCSVALLMASERDPLFLQVKEARRSVLEAFAGASAYANQGQRVVNGHWLVQPASDIFLGWAEGKLGRHVYFRQLRDMKMKAHLERTTPRLLAQYGELCGWALARAHARASAPAAISGYLGKGDVFDTAIAGFASAYADQTERDHAVLERAVRSGRVAIVKEEG